jgi:dihydrolipoamide dehydrogenase
MAELVIMPKLGFNMSEGKIVKWYKKEGETIKKGEPFFSVETDKTSIDIEATADGVVRKLFLEEGDKLPVTLPIAIVAADGENVDDLLAEAEKQLGIKASAPVKASEQPKESQGKEGNAYDFDVVVLGGGPGGYVAAIKAAQAGKITAIVEKDNFGGTCLNVGCIPTKALLRSVQALKEVKNAASYGIEGIDVSKVTLNMAKVQTRKKSVVSQLVRGVEGLLAGNGVKVYRSKGVIKDHHRILVGEEVITAEYIIIATGSEVKSLPIPVDEGMKMLTSNEALNLEEIPESIVVIGGGVIGIEFAYFLASAGSKVTVVEFLDRILPMVDEEITEQVTHMLQELGVEIHTGAKVTEVTKDAVVFEKGGSVYRQKTEYVLMAVGRVPNLAGIPCEALGIKTYKGAIVTDDTLKTSVDNIYAIGDVNGKAMLAHAASMEAAVAVKNIYGEDARMDYDKVPSAIYVSPEIASVGLTEAQARSKYGEVKVGRFPLFASGKAKVEGEERGLVKVIVEPKFNEILGIHLYCAHATEMIAEAVTAMKLEGTAEEMAMVIHPHPTVSEVLMEAFEAAVDKAVHFL